MFDNEVFMKINRISQLPNFQNLQSSALVLVTLFRKKLYIYIVFESVDDRLFLEFIRLLAPDSQIVTNLFVYRKIKSRTFTVFGLNPDTSAMIFHYFFTQSQPNAGAFVALAV